MPLNAPLLEKALRDTAARLAYTNIRGPVRLYVVGGSAGMLSGVLAGSRVTADVDVTAIEPDAAWSMVRTAAQDAAKELELPETWLNDDCRVYAWRLPLGWRTRCAHAHTFGPLEVWLLDRCDFIASKTVSAPDRPQDLEDLRAAKPTLAELDFTGQHIDRLERETLDPDQSFDDARVILRALRGDA